jgi:uroporphyrinogen III methyltransferase/synthase
MAFGKVYLAGAGPGDPGLITLGAVEALSEADCVIYDLLSNAALLRHAPPGAELLFVGKKGGRETIAQDAINRLLIKKAREHKIVVRLKGGDPFVFGRGGEEAEVLKDAGVPFEIIPGVTSASAVPAYAGIPVTHRDFASSVAIFSGHEDAVNAKGPDEWSAIARGCATLVFLMARRGLKVIASKLVQNGKDPETPSALVMNGTMTGQRTITAPLGRISEEAERCGVESPVVLVVGEVVKLREKLNWFETKPLFGKRVLVTRTLEQAGSFVGLLESKGAEPIQMPTIKITAPPDVKPLDAAIRRIGKYDWLIFTSVNGVKRFFERLKENGLDVRELKGVNICAIGPMTRKAVEEENIRVDLMPGEYRAEAVIEAIGRRAIKGKRFLLPRAMKAREILPEEIKRLGGRIDVVTVYRTVTPRADAAPIIKRFKERRVDVVTFTSSSTVDNFVKIVGGKNLAPLLHGVRVACIGPITADTARAHGMSVDIMPRDYTVAGLTEEMERYFA